MASNQLETVSARAAEILGSHFMKLTTNHGTSLLDSSKFICGWKRARQASLPVAPGAAAMSRILCARLAV